MTYYAATYGDDVVIAINKIALEVAASITKPYSVCGCGCLIRRNETCPRCLLDANKETR